MHRVLTHRAKPSAPREEALLREALALSGVAVDGNRPADVRVRNQAFYHKVLTQGVHGALEAYVDGWWECDRLDELAAKIELGAWNIPTDGRLSQIWSLLRATFVNLQNPRRSFQVQKHYDLGNDLFVAMLDRRLVYSCAWWNNARSLDDAQLAKLDLVARKIRLRPGMHVLDIGCGWGSFAQYAAEQYGATAVGITVSRQQCELGKTLCLGLPVELRLQDYRDLNDPPYDAVVSIGMLEHVGYKNYRTFLRIARRHLKPAGLLLLQTIGANESHVSVNPWIEQNIFPNGMLPSARQLAAAAEGLFVIEDWQNFGADYDKTLVAWFDNFRAHWPALQERYGPRFFRMWKCYLLTCAGSFRARKNQLWQLVLSPCGVPGVYRPIR